MNVLYLLLTILKTLGIVLIGIVVILLLILTLVIMIPVKYDLSINKEDAVLVELLIRWLYPFIKFKYIYNGEDSMSELLIFGIKVPWPKKEESNQLKETTKENKYTTESDKDSNQLGDTTKSNKNGNTSVNIAGTSKDSVVSTKPKKSRQKKDNPSNKKGKSSVRQIIDGLLGYQYKIEIITDTIYAVRNLIIHFKPSTLYVELEIGKEDPAETGKLIGIISALYPTYYSFMNIKGNYEEECLRGSMKVVGELPVYRLLYEIIKYIRLDSVKEILKFIKMIGKDDKNGSKVSKQPRNTITAIREFPYD